MKRKSCEITDPEAIRSVLCQATVGRLATLDAAGYPYVTPVNFVYHAGCIYFHCALAGEKLDNIARDPKVCFQVDIPLAYLDAAYSGGQPCNLHQFYHCVIMRGQARVLGDGPLKVEALNALVNKHEPGKRLTAVNGDMADTKACHVVEVRPESISAKSDLAQNKPAAVRQAIARHLKSRGRPGDRDTIEAFGFDPEAL